MELTSFDNQMYYLNNLLLIIPIKTNDGLHINTNKFEPYGAISYHQILIKEAIVGGPFFSLESQRETSFNQAKIHQQQTKIV